ncbi:DMT family transporter [Granulicella arctica]|uniref:DMT family transporter n=1 Tax=Granulicella arctica TaxID=940613 RepID=UPI0021DF6A9D|nr:DMT family transporter [Granulicella arctica]
MMWLSFLAALAAGAANPFQSGTNAGLNRQLGQPLWAGLIVYVSGVLGLLLMLAFVRQPLPTMAHIAAVKPWAWLGGLISIGSTLAGLVLAQRLGSANFTGLTLTASLVTSVVLDQMGWIGFRQHAASPGRLIGCGLMVVGVWMISRY